MTHVAGSAGVSGSEVARRLQSCGIRATEQRLRIAKVLLAAPQHLSAEQITEALESLGGHVSKATVYNTLNLFAKHGLIRQLSLIHIFKQVTWTPEWGQPRITGMIENRPDWCLSRQRVWGVPITLFTHRTSGQLHPRTQELIEQVAARVAIGGIDAWFDLDPAELLGSEAAAYEKASDVMDVWADSGLSFECVAATRSDFHSPVDLYLEGSDQHRGWFHSSLLTSVAMHGYAPVSYTHLRTWASSIAANIAAS